MSARLERPRSVDFVEIRVDFKTSLLFSFPSMKTYRQLLRDPSALRPPRRDSFLFPMTLTEFSRFVFESCLGNSLSTNLLGSGAPSFGTEVPISLRLSQDDLSIHSLCRCRTCGSIIRDARNGYRGLLCIESAARVHPDSFELLPWSRA